MKFVAITILLSFSLLASTAYFGNHYLQSSSEVVIQKSQQIDGTCLYLDIFENGWFTNFNAKNVCQKPLKFTIIYSAEPGSHYILKTACLKENLEDQTDLDYNFTISKVFEEEC